MNICQCGCGKQCKNKYVCGHNIRIDGYKFPKGCVPWNKGLNGKDDPRVNYAKQNGFKKGCIPWNKELTKDSNSTLIKVGLKSKERWKNSEYRENIIDKTRKSRRENGNYKCSETTKQRRSNSMKNYLASPEKREKWKQIALKTNRERGDELTEKRMKNRGTAKFEYFMLDGSIVYRRSNWERKYAGYLDRLDIEWEYEPKQFKLSNGRRYWPDFYLPQFDEYHEVKGYVSEDSKHIQFQREYPEILLKTINGDFLKEKNLIKEEYGFYNFQKSI